MISQQNYEIVSESQLVLVVNKFEDDKVEDKCKKPNILLKRASGIDKAEDESLICARGNINNLQTGCDEANTAFNKEQKSNSESDDKQNGNLQAEHEGNHAVPLYRR